MSCWPWTRPSRARAPRASDPLEFPLPIRKSNDATASRVLFAGEFDVAAIDGGGNETRAYAHCGGDEGGLVLMLINPALAADVNASVRGLRLHGGALPSLRREIRRSRAESGGLCELGPRVCRRDGSATGLRLCVQLRELANANASAKASTRAAQPLARWRSA